MKSFFLNKLSILVLGASIMSFIIPINRSNADCLPVYDAKILEKEKEIAFYAALSPFSLINIPIATYKTRSLLKLMKARNIIAQAQVGYGADLEAAYQDLMSESRTDAGYSALSEVDLSDIDQKTFIQLVRQANENKFFCYGKKISKYSEIIDSFRNGKLKRYIGFEN